MEPSYEDEGPTAWTFKMVPSLEESWFCGSGQS